MKKYLVAATLLLPSFLLAQKIKVSEKDKFLKTYRIETNEILVKGNMKLGFSMGLRSVDTTVFVKLEGYNILKTGITEGSSTIFLLSDETTISIYSKGLQYTTRPTTSNTFSFEYFSTIDDIKKLTVAKIVAVRFYSGSGYVDIDLTKDQSEKINKVCNVFVAEYDRRRIEF